MKAKLVLIVLVLGATALAADPEPYLKSAPMPFYPPLARQARIQGKITIHFTINEQGDTSEVEAVAGHELLRSAAIESIKNWKFAWPHPCSCHVKREVVFGYSLSGDWLDQDGPIALVRWFGKSPVTRVEIQAGLPLINE